MHVEIAEIRIPGVLCDRLLENMGGIAKARDIARQYFDKQSLGRRSDDYASTEGVPGRTAASQSESSLAAHQGVAAPHKVGFPPSGPPLEHKRNVEGQLQGRITEYDK